MDQERGSSSPLQNQNILSKSTTEYEEAATAENHESPAGEEINHTK